MRGVGAHPDDVEELNSWSHWLAQDGRLMISVPAHRQRWKTSDVWGGHVLCYDRKDIENVLNCTGFEIDHFESYGYSFG